MLRRQLEEIRSHSMMESEKPGLMLVCPTHQLVPELFPKSLGTAIQHLREDPTTVGSFILSANVY